MPPSFRTLLRRLPLSLSLWMFLGVVSACGRGGHVAEEHRKLSLRLEHSPPKSGPADHEIEIQARLRSSLESPRLECWIRVWDEGDSHKISMRLEGDGEARGRLPSRPRGTVLRYSIEARDAAGLVVSLPKNAAAGKGYEIRYEGKSSPFLAGLAAVGTFAGVFLFFGAAAAGAEHLRGRMSIGPTGLLAGLGVAAIAVGLFVIGGIHAFQVTGFPWPSRPLFLSLSRGDLGLVSLAWTAVLFWGRRTLVDDLPEGAPKQDRVIAVAGIAAAAALVILALV